MSLAKTGPNTRGPLENSLGFVAQIPCAQRALQRLRRAVDGFKKLKKVFGLLSEEGEFVLRKALLTTLFYFVVALVAASPAVAEPPVPSWPRGGEGTTFQEWSFSDANSTPTPDNLFNPYAAVENPVLLHVDTDHDWYESLDLGRGVWALSGEIDIVIPNNPEPNPYKDILIYLVWKEQGNDPTGAPFNKDPFLPDEPLVAVAPFVDMEMNLQDIPENGWHHSSYSIRIWPNPQKEWISIKGNILVDYLAIDTVCVPEPATIAILTLGGLFILRTRKNKN